MSASNITTKGAAINEINDMEKQVAGESKFNHRAFNKILLAIFVLVVVLLAAVAIPLTWWFSSSNRGCTPVEHDSSPTSLLVLNAPNCLDCLIFQFNNYTSEVEVLDHNHTIVTGMPAVQILIDSFKGWKPFNVDDANATISSSISGAKSTKFAALGWSLLPEWVQKLLVKRIFDYEVRASLDVGWLGGCIWRERTAHLGFSVKQISTQKELFNLHFAWWIDSTTGKTCFALYESIYKVCIPSDPFCAARPDVTLYSLLYGKIKIIITSVAPWLPVVVMLVMVDVMTTIACAAVVVVAV